MFVLDRLFSKQRTAFTRLVITGGLAATGFWFGFAPNVSRPHHPHVAFAQPAHAQGAVLDFSTDQLQNYARAVLAIEPLRRDTHERIRELMGSRPVPPIACNRRDVLATLPRNVREEVQTYCDRSIALVRQYGLSISEFNEITRQAQSQPQLERRIQQYMLQQR